MNAAEYLRLKSYVVHAGYEVEIEQTQNLKPVSNLRSVGSDAINSSHSKYSHLERIAAFYETSSLQLCSTLNLELEGKGLGKVDSVATIGMVLWRASNLGIIDAYNPSGTEWGREDLQRCRVCRCTQSMGCFEVDGGTCHWAEDDLCSACQTADLFPHTHLAMAEFNSQVDRFRSSVSKLAKARS